MWGKNETLKGHGIRWNLIGGPFPDLVILLVRAIEETLCGSDISTPQEQLEGHLHRLAG